MKKMLLFLTLALFAVAVLSFAAEDLRPAQKAMQARLAWMTAIKQNLGAGNFDLIARDANELAAQTKKNGETLPNPLAKELTLAISTLAKDLSVAAGKKGGEAVKTNWGAIKGKCDECHTKIRDKK